MRSAWKTLAVLACLLGPVAAHSDTVNVDLGVTGGSCCVFKTISNVPGVGTNATTINAGDTVHWTWRTNSHTVTADTKVNGKPLFDSGLHNTTFTYDLTFDTPGTYPYRCTIHSTTMTGTITVNNPKPTLTALNPTFKTAGDAAFNLTVTGTGFTNASTVQWNGSNRTTTFVSGTALTVAIPASDLTTPGTANVAVVNPAPGGGTSAKIVFAIKSRLSGIVTMDGAADPAQSLTFELRPSANKPPVQITQTLGAGGEFSLSGVEPDTYDLAIKGSKWLRTVLKQIDVTKANALNLSPLLLPGDLNDDNEIGLDDLVIFFDAYGSVPGDPNWNPDADLSCDSSVELDDLSLFFDNYGKVGDP